MHRYLTKIINNVDFDLEQVLETEKGRNRVNRRICQIVLNIIQKFHNKKISLPNVETRHALSLQWQSYIIENRVKFMHRYLHANYAEYDAVISIPEGEVLKGEMPNKKLKLVKAWI